MRLLRAGQRSAPPLNCGVRRQMSRPRIYLLVILPLLILGGLLVIFLTLGAYATTVGIPLRAVPELNAFLIALPALFLWIPVSLLIANVVLTSVPPLRRVAETYVKANARPDYRTSQRQLSKVVGWTACVCVPLILLGWVM
jgi:hypothetical protein